MGLFDKKYCDVCGAKIGFLGNRKLEDGNLCKDCAGKLSPFFSDRRNSTVAEIKEQLAYREENKQQLDDFLPSVTFDGSKKVYIDPISERFIVTGLSNWRGGNPDLISFSQVRNVETDIRENKEEIFYKDSEGNEKSYNPRRYECDYEFNVTIHVDSPWFDEIELELSDGNRPDSRFTDLYREYEQKMHELADILMRRDNRHRVFDGDGMMKQIGAEDERPDSAPASQPSGGEWVCPSCGSKTTGAKFCDSCGALKPAPVEAAAAQTSAGETWVCPSCGTEGQSKKFCENCGCQRPVPKTVRCASCGYTPENQAKPPKFCPECGKPLC